MVYNLLTISLITGFGPQGGHVPGQAPDPEVQTQHADQQGAHAQVRRREPLQVSFLVKYWRFMSVCPLNLCLLMCAYSEPGIC